MLAKRDQNLYLRAKIIQAIRLFFINRDFLEVETPHRIPSNAPEEYIDPFYSESWQLHTSPELCMKRLLSRGHERIFQICRCWRKGERGTKHLSEFTMLEWYRGNSDYHQLMSDCEELLGWVSEQIGDRNSMMYQGHPIDPTRRPERLTVREAFRLYAGKEMEASVADGTFDEVMVTRIEPSLSREVPVFLIDYPAEMAALACLKPDDPSVAERFELYLGGLELANGFSELNDPREQRQRFEQANERRSSAGHKQPPLPEQFLCELADMPPSAGIALGVDRLAMLFANTGKIDEVSAFTPEEL